jgi:hypothetical protein
MAQTERSRSSAPGYTRPKDRPTPRRNSRSVTQARRAAQRARLQWVTVAAVLIGVVALVIVLGGDGGGFTTAPIGRHG